MRVAEQVEVRAQVVVYLPDQNPVPNPNPVRNPDRVLLAADVNHCGDVVHRFLQKQYIHSL